MFKQALTFDDVTLEPCYSDIKSRFSDEIDLSTSLFPMSYHLKYPLISANMDSITTGQLASTMSKQGGLGIIHRFMDFPSHHKELECVPLEHRMLCLGVDEDSRKRLDYFLKIDLKPTAILIDIAHGYCRAMKDMVKHVQSMISVPIMAGNISNYDGALFLADLGVQSIKTGQGGGSVCTTRIQTGNGVPQFTAIQETARAVRNINRPISIISDGGHRHSGDIVKALAAGAHAIMSGNLFAGCDEASGETVYYPTPAKRYRGMSGKESQLSWKGSYAAVEGEETWVPLKGPVHNVIADLIGGIRSGFSYQGARNIAQLQENPIFYLQTHAGYLEGTPHGKR